MEIQLLMLQLNIFCTGCGQKPQSVLCKSTQLRVTGTKFTTAANAADGSREGIKSQSVVQHFTEQSAKILTTCPRCKSAPTSAPALQLLSCSAGMGWRHRAPQPVLLGRASHSGRASSTCAGRTWSTLGSHWEPSLLNLCNENSSEVCVCKAEVCNYELQQ